jgi:Asp-tRNA(Asn)/Glu-tRNA(Gln) amidotransferase A subunit family amidase
VTTDDDRDPYDAWVVRDAAQTASPGGPLAGMTFGVKDIFDVRGLPTRGGIACEPPAAGSDAWCVAALRAASAVPVGKTRTTPFAFRDPTITRNPRAAGRTPGGSSSGSAAAVAAGDVPFAIGSQTLGSTLRPAAYCGIVGYKPTFGLVPTVGMLPLAPSLDHVGVIARDIATATAVAHAWGIPEAAVPCRRIVVVRDFANDAVAEESREALDLVARCAGELGVALSRILHLPRETELLAAVHVVNAFEAARMLGTPATATPALAELLARGRAIDYAAYDVARREPRRALPQWDAILGDDAIAVVPVANAAPPMTSTGDPTPQAHATLLGLPALTLPVGTFADGTPRGVQCIAARGADAMLLAFAATLERALAGAVEALASASSSR